MDADNQFYVKFIATYAPTFFGYIISVLATVGGGGDTGPSEFARSVNSIQTTGVDYATQTTAPPSLKLKKLSSLWQCRL